MRVLLSSLLVVAFALLLAHSVEGQETVQIIDGKPVRMVDGKPVPMGRPGPGGEKAEAKPGGDEKSKEGDKAAEGKSEKPPETKVIRREQTDGEEADPEELKATVGEDGRVAFEFRNQPWVALVQWLSDISDQPLDWQELPGDRVNLTSPGRYTVSETSDLFNRHLLARGYTLLEVDGGLTIAKTENINPALVQLVTPAELERVPAYTFVRTLLDVGWLSAEKLAEELKPMISQNGRLTALSTTNRIEAMDAAINLRQIATLLNEERSTASRDALAPEFKLRYIPAEDAKQMLEQFLGVEQKKEAPMSPQQMQMMQRMAQQNQQAGTPPEPKVEISIVANLRQNSVLVRAPKDRIAVAFEFLKRIDLPSDAVMSLADLKSRVEVHRLASLDPEKFIEIIKEMNVLEPQTHLRADNDNMALIVSGAGADRFIIKSMIERLDGSSRKFEVLQLRRLNSAEVAESIAFLMGQEKEDDDSSSNRRSYYYGYYGSGDDDKDKQQDKFRVSANARFNQVLLWANDNEMEQVRSLLVKLGELPPPGGNKRTVRMIDASATPETYEYLLRLRKQWQSISNNPLELPEQEDFKDPIAEIKAVTKAIEAEEDAEAGADDETPETENKPAAPKKSNDAKPLPIEVTKSDDATVAVDEQAHTDQHYQLTMMQRPDPTDETDQGSAGEPARGPMIQSAEDFDRMFGTRGGQRAGDETAERQTEAGQAAPVQISIDSQGNLVITGSDTEALDRLEDLMLQVRPPQRPYHVFKIKYATASWVQINLEDYFKDLEDDSGSDADSFYRWYWGRGDEEQDSGPAGLGKNNELRFVWDNDTNTIVVSGATPEQLQTIAELIELWDVPEAVDKKRMRYTELVPVRYSRASRIADTVKEAYRDLLSSNDKAFGGGGQKGQQSGGGSAEKETTQRNRAGDGSGLTDQESGREGGGSNFSFTGKLSIGVDEVGNTLIVSAEGEALLKLIVGKIEQLDEAARPSGEVEVVKVSGGVSGRSLLDALEAFGAKNGAAPTAEAAGQSNEAGPKRDIPDQTR